MPISLARSAFAVWKKILASAAKKKKDSNNVRLAILQNKPVNPIRHVDKTNAPNNAALNKTRLQTTRKSRLLNPATVRHRVIVRHKIITDRLSNAGQGKTGHNNKGHRNKETVRVAMRQIRHPN
jgi:hypothetical protein